MHPKEAAVGIPEKSAGSCLKRSDMSYKMKTLNECSKNSQRFERRRNSQKKPYEEVSRDVSELSTKSITGVISKGLIGGIMGEI